MFKRWKMTTRTNRGAYGVRDFFRKSKAERFAQDYENNGLGVARVTKR